MKKALTISSGSLLVCLGLFIQFRTFIVYYEPPPSVSGDQKLNTPGDVLKTDYFYEKQIKPRLEEHGIQYSHWFHKYMILKFDSADHSSVVVPVFSRKKAVEIRDAMQTGIREFQEKTKPTEPNQRLQTIPQRCPSGSREILVRYV